MTGRSAAHLDVIMRYYDGCSLGDVEMMLSTLHPDVVHYFLDPNPACAPIRGAEAIAAFWRKIQPQIDGHWLVDHIVSDGRDRAVIEWSLYWRRDVDSPRVVTRGSEWFDFQDGLVYEIRSYYQQLHRHTDLRGYPYDARGYSMPGTEHSTIHRALPVKSRSVLP